MLDGECLSFDREVLQKALTSSSPFALLYTVLPFQDGISFYGGLFKPKTMTLEMPACLKHNVTPIKPTKVVVFYFVTPLGAHALCSARACCPKIDNQ